MLIPFKNRYKAIKSERFFWQELRVPLYLCYSVIIQMDNGTI